MLSRDDGTTWNYEERTSLAWDAPNVNCGYANGAQSGDGTIAVTYYIMHEKGSYRNLWKNSKIYLVRFTEEEFVRASKGDTASSDSDDAGSE